jgi:hypothetical protein
VVARSAQEVVAALDISDAQLGRMAADARERVLAEHTSQRRVAQLERMLDEARRPEPAPLAATQPQMENH